MKQIKRIPEIIILVILLTVLTYKGSLIRSNNKSNSDSSSNFNIEDARKYLDKANKISIKDKDFAKVYDESGNLSGEILSTDPIANNIIGFNNAVPVLIYIDNSKLIKGIQLLENSESRGYIRRIRSKGFFERWNNMTVKEASTANIDCVSGASMTTGAIKQGVKLKLNDYLKKSSIGESNYNFISILAYALSLLLLIFAIVSMFNTKIAKKYRLLLLVSSILILGIWQGNFLSLALMFGWMIQGIPVLAKLFVLIVLSLAILLPLFINKSFYCTYLCPYGCAQELVGKIKVKKLKIPSNVSKKLKIFRLVFFYIILLVEIASVYYSFEFDVSTIEPFSIFKIQAAPISVIIIGSFFLVFSIFSPRFWCRYICPLGYFFDIFKKTKRIKK